MAQSAAVEVVPASNNALTPMDMLNRWLAYDPLTGIVSWKAKPNRNVIVGSPAGCQWPNGRNTYIRITCQGQWVFAHVIAFFATYRRPPRDRIDHINGDGTDNRLVNLREVSHTENLRNQRRNINNKSGMMGVDFHRAAGKWRARIIVDKRERHLGTFGTYEEAVVARSHAERLFGFHENHGRTS